MFIIQPGILFVVVLVVVLVDVRNDWRRHRKKNEFIAERERERLGWK